MVNTAETLPPKSLLKNINLSATFPPGNMIPDQLQTGDSIGSKYIIEKKLPIHGSQADIYIAQKDQEQYVVKIYHKGWEPSAELQNILQGLKHPNLVSILESGRYHGYHYEIMDYYQEGTLHNQGALPLSAAEIEDYIVPSINEGLHELHSHNIIHCDIKPSNLFFSCNKKRIVIGDCGVSKFTNPNGYLLDTLHGTPEYAIPVKGMLWKDAISPAFDYGSFGLVICAAILGKSLFNGMSVEMIENAWENGLVLPPQICGRIGSLIRGLLIIDESIRWGYQDVKRWCNGEFVSINTNVHLDSEEQSHITPMVFGTINGEILTVSSFHQLANAIRAHWNQARNVIKKVEVADFIYQFDNDMNLWKAICELRNEQDLDTAVYKLLNYIEDDWQNIFYCGTEYQSLNDLINHLIDGNDPTALKYLQSGLLVLYLRQNNAPEQEVEKLEKLINRNQPVNMEAISTICYALQGTSQIEIFGEKIYDLDGLVSVICHHTITEIDEILHNDKFIAWMNRMGYEKEMKRMKGEFK